jgi:hypothetical protein
MSYSFRPARRSEAKPLIGLYSESGAGKTYSALLLARGFVGPAGKIGMIETESGRGEAYADIIPGGYDVLPIREDFSPRNYGEAIAAAEAAKLDALIIDSASHEWEGAGGVLSMAAENQAKGVTGVLVWQQPKMQHQRLFMLKLMQTPISLVIVCMRAKYPMIQGINPANNKKEWYRSEELEPKQSEDILFEMFVHGWIDRGHKLHVTKCNREDLRPIFQDNKPITLETGAALARWAAGTTSPERERPASKAGAAPTTDRAAPAEETDSERLTRLSAELKAAKRTGGNAALAAKWKEIDPPDQHALEDTKEDLKAQL